MDNRRRSFLFSNFFGYMKHLDPHLLKKLYEHRSISFAVYRSLPEVNQVLVMRIIALNSTIKNACVNIWTQEFPEAKKETEEAFEYLKALKLLESDTSSSRVCPEFKSSLQTALIQGPCRSDLKVKTRSSRINDICKAAQKTWDSLLQFIVGSQDRSLDGFLITLLTRSQIVRFDNGSRSIRINPLGFKFILLDTKTQVTTLILENLQDKDAFYVEVFLKLLFDMSLLNLGDYVKADQFSQYEHKILRHMRIMGLAYFKSKEGKDITNEKIFPTQFTIGLTVGELNVENDQEEYLVIESNFRVYGYNCSKFKMDLLRSFLDIEIEDMAPHMLVCRLTRDSAMRAFKEGITADQIIDYMEKHCHKNMRSEDYLSGIYDQRPIPLHLRQQLRLWEKERDCLEFQPGTLIDGFEDVGHFTKACAYAAEIGTVVWSSDQSLKMVVQIPQDLHPKDFMENMRKVLQY